MRWIVLGSALVLAVSLGNGQESKQEGIRGPWDHDLYLFTSEDGQDFGNDRVFVNRAGVACLARDGKGRLHALFQWFPLDRKESFDRVAAVHSDDDGVTWTKPQPIEISELPRGQLRPADPTLVVREDGTLRLYFTSLSPTEPDPATYSAVSVDGIHYIFEGGRRFGVAGKMVLDCAATHLDKTWHYYAPVEGEQGKAYHATSEDGLHFKKADLVNIPGLRQWLGCAIKTEKGLRFFGTGKDGIWSAVSTDGGRWVLEGGSRGWGQDPAVVQTRDGKWLMLATGPPRPDAGKVRPPTLPPTADASKPPR